MNVSKAYIILVLVIMSGCASIRTPQGYLPKSREADQFPYGSWMTLIHLDDSTAGTRSAQGGELIAIQEDILYLLFLDSLKQFHIGNIEQAVVATHDYGGPQFLIWGGASTLPNLVGMVGHTDYAGGFAFLGILQAVPAGLATLINSLSTYEIKYPDHIQDLESLSVYARFPQGIPRGIDPGILTSKPLLH